jgi:hypothetical protein
VYAGDDRESMKRDVDFYCPLNELSWFKSMETVGVEDVAVLAPPNFLLT